MAYFTLSAITGCHSPVTGLTTGYDIQYNDDKIVSYMKKDINRNSNNGFIEEFLVVVTFENYTQLFKFMVSSDRDTFYTSLP